MGAGLPPPCGSACCACWASSAGSPGWLRAGHSEACAHLHIRSCCITSKHVACSEEASGQVLVTHPLQLCAVARLHPLRSACSRFCKCCSCSRVTGAAVHLSMVRAVCCRTPRGCHGGLGANQVVLNIRGAFPTHGERFSSGLDAIAAALPCCCFLHAMPRSRSTTQTGKEIFRRCVTVFKVKAEQFLDKLVHHKPVNPYNRCSPPVTC